MAYEIIFEVLIVLAFAVIVGEIFEQLGLASVAGELLAGIILGPAVLGIVTSNDQIQAISSVALFFIIFHIGIELETQSLQKHVHKASLVALTALVLPFILALILCIELLPFFGFVSDFVVALSLAVPSISIISVLVLQYDIMKQDSGQIILASTVISDVLAFLLLAVVSFPTTSTLSIVLATVAFTAAFIGIDYMLNTRPRLVLNSLKRIGSLLKREDISYAFLIVLGLMVAVFFELIGISFILGAFFAGLIIHDGLVGRKGFQNISLTFTKMNRAFFIPLFFGFAGTEAHLSSGELALLLFALPAILLISIPPSLGLTYSLSRRLFKLESRGAREVAIILGGRGAVGIVIASVALSRALINSTAYSLIIVGTLAASLAVPLALRERRGGGRKKEKKQQRQ